MSSFTRRVTTAVAATTAMLTLAACGGGSGGENTPAAEGAEGTTPVTLMLNWYPTVSTPRSTTACRKVFSPSTAST